jgi:sugar phosphate isomerase/epimerase
MMQIGTNLVVTNFQKNLQELKDKTDFVELYLHKIEGISSIIPHKNQIPVVHLLDLNESIFEALEITYQLNAEKAVIHFFTNPQGNFETKIGLLRKLCKCAEEYDIRLCLENTTENVRLMEILFEKVSDLWFCLDIGHANLWNNHPLEFIDAFSSRLCHIHIHDNRGGFYEKSDLHLAPGEGNIDFSKIFSSLASIQYSELITFERTPWDDNQRVISIIDNIRRMIKEQIK